MAKQRERNGGRRTERGYTVLELLVTMVIVSIMSGTAISSLREYEHRSASAAADIAAVLKRARGKAITSLTTVTVRPGSDTTLVTTTGSSCSATQTVDEMLDYTLPPDVKLVSTAWSICYSNRGLSTSSETIVVRDERKRESRAVQVVLGGGVRLQ